MEMELVEIHPLQTCLT